ncbi:MAG: SET domain-containing protein [Candidatus Paceibacteria bacterium]|jgi:SET domain-containing protein
MPKNITPKKPAPGKARKKKPSMPLFDNERVLVQESLIHGLGLFSAKSMRKGQTIGYYEGKRIETEDDFDGDHVLWIFDEEHDHEYGIDGNNETRFVNHSGTPNANFDGERLIALRGIKKGEEITHDYGEAWAEMS